MERETMDEKLEAAPGESRPEIETATTGQHLNNNSPGNWQAASSPVTRGEFAETAMRDYCRNPKCRMRLPAPVSNEREAFCTRGCYNSFYLRRCRVCEGRIEQPKCTTRLICKKSKCRNAWAARAGFGRYAEASGRDGSQKVPVNSGSTSASEPVEQGWKQIAGPALTLSQFHCATRGGGAMGEVRRIEAKNRALLQEAEQAEIAANGEFTNPGWREVVSPDGVKCFITKSAPIKRAITKTITAETITTQTITTEMAIPDDLSIPGFLRRQS
jgi:hypothetical protein